MTDDLRTRITAAIRAVDDMRVCKLHDADIKFITEAVIAELGLHREELSEVGSSVLFDDPRPHHRYVTDWIADG